MQIKTLQRSLAASVLVSALLFSCADKEKKTETEVKADTTVVTPPVVIDTSTVMDTGGVKPVVPTAPK